jgi:hypothetical protein
MVDSKFYFKKLTTFIYLQPEYEVSIEKTLLHFSKLTRDEFNSLINEAEQEKLVSLTPKSNLSLQDGGEITDEGEFIEITDGEISNIIDPTHISLTLQGKELAEQEHTLSLKAKHTLLINPLINSIISLITGVILGYLGPLIIKLLLHN